VCVASFTAAFSLVLVVFPLSRNEVS